MGDRKKRILEAVTDDYIMTAEPVGSRTIAKRYDLGVSPCDYQKLKWLIWKSRDIWSSLMYHQVGFPSQKGYRFYVDFIMKSMDVSDEERLQISRSLKKRRGNWI